jgi:hypothetical protein
MSPVTPMLAWPSTSEATFSDTPSTSITAAGDASHCTRTIDPPDAVVLPKGKVMRPLLRADLLQVRMRRKTP